MDQVAKYRQLSEQLRACADGQIYPESRAQMLQLAEHWDLRRRTAGTAYPRGGAGKGAGNSHGNHVLTQEWYGPCVVGMRPTPPPNRLILFGAFVRTALRPHFFARIYDSRTMNVFARRRAVQWTASRCAYTPSSVIRTDLTASTGPLTGPRCNTAKNSPLARGLLQA